MRFTQHLTLNGTTKITLQFDSPEQAVEVLKHINKKFQLHGKFEYMDEEGTSSSQDEKRSFLIS